MSTGCWLAVASADHVRRGRAGGFMQVCHGRAAPLRRIAAGDGIVYYSPSTDMGGKDGPSAVTAIATVRDGDPYQLDMGGGFCPFRRDVEWAASCETPISTLLGRLDFTSVRNWGYQLRLGLCQLTERDFALIAEAMGADCRAIA
ncbi:EVE domain-containing protein [Aminobacter sp. AP02]|uniref:EVE domain-containing protein n=1 Tax=Aminobacter sp. AP02 TaxID=2135737 RepID=UPI000D6B4D07|nr:EVE domain-containing protein [Aminobacter sp. AP02]PWK70683.1 EVE domain-containing protein [Aminobacter sp. AP02]